MASVHGTSDRKAAYHDDLDDLDRPAKYPEPAWKVQLKQDLVGMSFADQMDAVSVPRAHPYAIQRSGAGSGDTSHIHAAAAEGVSGSGGTLPHMAQIQESFGGHDISGVKAHVGGKAAAASESMGAVAYATGGDIAFKSAPDLHTAAHEAAHTVQQAAGVSLPGGVGSVGDSYEKHADAVADKVVSGQSAEGLLSNMTGGGGGGVQQRADDAVQMAEDEGKAPARTPAVQNWAKVRTRRDTSGAMPRRDIELKRLACSVKTSQAEARRLDPGRDARRVHPEAAAPDMTGFDFPVIS